jgi:hypothetical protein
VRAVLVWRFQPLRLIHLPWRFHAHIRHGVSSSDELISSTVAIGFAETIGSIALILTIESVVTTPATKITVTTGNVVMIYSPITTS